LGKDNSDEYLKKGREAFSCGAYEDAITFFSNSINVNPNNVETYVQKSTAHLYLGDMEKALLCADKGIEKSKECAEKEIRSTSNAWSTKSKSPKVAKYY
jgi:tetratricopeptide (TPR) repeat protein